MFRMLTALLLASLPHTVFADDALKRYLGETVYVPAYSRIFTYESRSELLAATLSVHNIDPETPIRLESAVYHDEAGAPLRNLIEDPVDLAPFQSISLLVPINDTTGGIGANFIVTWSSAVPALSPLSESVMTGAPGTPGPSFTSRGRAIRQDLDGR
ncbi:DUF3124 domain-containing protein [Roseibium denhamense]|nr:DUF3124 domain-containing protein [Roseibium denhamense]MTI07177.1 DUF3124 domain-containing protein [Roseibium denhamense]